MSLLRKGENMSGQINTTRQELERAFLNLPTLKYVGMALMQFAFRLQKTDNLWKDFEGVFCMDFVSFSFPKGQEKIKMFIRGVEINCDKIQEFGFRWLPLEKLENGLVFCEITHHGQLGQAVKYIWIAYNNYMSTRQIPSDSAASN
jgi:hypothetical protein